MAYSKITNKLFYTNKEDEESILKIINNNKVVLVMHYLYLLTNRCGKATVSLDFLIEECGYKVDKDSRKSFKNIVDKLKELGYIYFTEISKSNEVIEIDTNKLNVDKEFFVVEDEELELIRANTEDIREFINVVKVYYYLKARIYKKQDDTILDCRSQSTFNPYLDIANRTLISERNIKKYIDILQEINLIKYDNLGYKYRVDNIQAKTECANVYVLIKVSKDEETLNYDLKEGLKAQELYYNDKGFIVTKKGYKDNDKKRNGIFGSLIKKENNNSLTEKEREELCRLRLEKELKKDDI
ncbi:hypothetical protein [Clostridium tertium]|uniref:hypothetical protein n=1 Tax=Clostridium tertium TaxID=1559 RepID=UPI00356A6D87